MKKKNLLIAAILLSPFCCLAETTQGGQPEGAETVIAFLPVIFFLLILIVTTFKLKAGNIKLSDLLAEKDTPITAAGTNPPPPQSVSRFIAFLTGLVALTIGVCLTTFYMYCYFNNPGKNIDLSNLTTVIWGLGIGVLPYGFNKGASALKP